MHDFFTFERLDWLWRLLVAQCVTFIFFAMSLVSFSMPMTGQVRPFFILMAIYYWAIYRPTLIPPVLVFFVGLLFDFLANFPVGIHAILFLAVQWTVRDQRTFLTGQPYVMVFLGFVLTCSFVYLSEWIFFSFLNGSVFPIIPILGSFLASILLFPLATLLFILTHRILPVASHAIH